MKYKHPTENEKHIDKYTHSFATYKRREKKNRTHYIECALEQCKTAHKIGNFMKLLDENGETEKVANSKNFNIVYFVKGR